MTRPRLHPLQLGELEFLDERPRQGGQAMVWKARLRPSERLVAVKVAHRRPSAIRGVASEIAELEKIHQAVPDASDWLVTPLDTGVSLDGEPFLVLAWRDHSLDSWITATQPELPQRLELLHQCISAVVRLHRSPGPTLSQVRVHRDLKPGNFLVDASGEGARVILADLGGTKERVFNAPTMNTGMFTPGYAPVEQCLPIELRQDISVDIYALGVMVFEVLATRVPQCALTRQHSLSDEGIELFKLVQVRGRTPAQQVRMTELRQRSLEQLTELRDEPSLPEPDRNRLLGRVEEELAWLEPGVGSSRRRAEALVACLEVALKGALKALPEGRSQDARGLLAAVEGCLDMLEPKGVPAGVEAPGARPEAAVGSVSVQTWAPGEGGGAVAVPAPASRDRANLAPPASVEAPVHPTTRDSLTDQLVLEEDPGEPGRGRAVWWGLAAGLAGAGLLAVGVVALGLGGLGLSQVVGWGEAPAEPEVEGVLVVEPGLEDVGDDEVVEEPGGEVVVEVPGGKEADLGEPPRVGKRTVARPSPESVVPVVVSEVPAPVEDAELAEDPAPDPVVPPVEVTVAIDYTALGAEVALSAWPSGACTGPAYEFLCGVVEGVDLRVTARDGPGGEVMTMITARVVPVGEGRGRVTVTDRSSGISHSLTLRAEGRAKAQFSPGDFDGPQYAEFTLREAVSDP